jgi:peptide/nickel transport system permease protein
MTIQGDQMPPADTAVEAPEKPRANGLDPVGQAVSRPPRRRGRVALALSAGWLGLVVVAALGADLLPLHPYDVPVGPARQGPGLDSIALLGTDPLGRSQLSRLVYGARVSLAIGFASVLLGLTVGGFLGLAAGYFRGKVAEAVAILADTLLAIPPLFLLLAITAIFTQTLPTLVAALAVLTMPTFIRLARANTLSFASREFVDAARALGGGHGRIMFRELLPNVVLPLASYSFLVVAVVVVAEGSLSFLGLGIPPPQPSWGGMVSAGRDLLATQPEQVFIPSTALLFTVLSLNVLGDHARRRYDKDRSVS